jgi:STE24 endopeptidase
VSAGARRAAGLLIAVALVAAGVYAATRLWHTQVPGDLSRPPVDVDATFGRQAVDRAASFEAFVRVTTLLGQLALLVTLALYAWRGARFMRESAAGPIGTGFLLGMLGLAIVWLVQLPFTLVELWWLRRHDVVEIGYLEAILTGLVGLSGTFLFICFALLVAMGLARLLRGRWWLPAAAVFVGLYAGLAYVSPYLSVDDPAPRWVQRQGSALSAVEGIDGRIPVRVQEVHDFTSQPNAFAAGLGPTRRVVLWDTLLHGFPRPQVRVVVAHELGHQARRHIAKGIGWFALVILPTALIVALATRRRGGMAAPEAVPLALLVVVVLSLVTGPLQSAATRRYEAEADWTALQATRDPRAMEGLFRGFTRRALADPDPPGWWHVLFDDHPSGKQRVQMARAWAARNGG